MQCGDRQSCPVTQKNHNVLVFVLFFLFSASVGQAGILWFSGHILFNVVLTARGRQQVIFAFVNSIKLKVNIKTDCQYWTLYFSKSLHIRVVSPFVLSYFSKTGTGSSTGRKGRFPENKTQYVSCMFTLSWGLFFNYQHWSGGT